MALVPLRVLSLKRSTEGAFTVPFRVLSRKNIAENIEDITCPLMDMNFIFEWST